MPPYVPPPPWADKPYEPPVPPPPTYTPPPPAEGPGSPGYTPNPGAPPTDGSIPPVPPTTPAPTGPAQPWMSDPILVALRNSVNANVAAGRARMTEGQRTALQSLGSVDLARSLFGADPWVQTVGLDPNSEFARIASQYLAGTKDTARETSARNTFYGSGRRNALNALARGRLGMEADAIGDARTTLTGLGDAFADLQRGEGERLTEGELDAYNRWLEDELENGAPGPDTDGEGTPGATVKFAGKTFGTADFKEFKAFLRKHGTTWAKVSKKYPGYAKFFLGTDNG